MQCREWVGFGAAAADLAWDDDGLHRGADACRRRCDAVRTDASRQVAGKVVSTKLGGEAQDVEGAITADGSVHIVQSRLQIL